MRNLHSIMKTGMLRLLFPMTLAFVGPLALLLTAASAGDGCLPSFPFKDGWWGADAAYSIPLPDGRVVWIFGDTLYGDKRLVSGQVPRMVRNSIAVSTCGAEKVWKVEYIIRGMKSGTPKDFFEAGTSRHWYWALDGFYHGGNLWVTLLRVRDKPNSGTEVFNFEICGADLARITNLNALPEKWKIKTFPLVPDGVGAYPSATSVIEGNYVYIFAQYDKGTHPMVLSRIRLAGLGNPAKHLEYLSKDGTWKAGFDPGKALVVMTRGASEMSVRYHPDLKKWIAVLPYPDMPPTGKILLRSAPALIGPWTEGQIVYRMPDMQTDYPHYDKDTFCYAAKEHKEFRRPGELLVTYVCNSFIVKKVESNLDIYYPKVVQIPLPKEP